MEQEPIKIAGKQTGNEAWQRIYKGFILLGVALIMLIGLSKIIQPFINNPNYDQLAKSYADYGMLCSSCMVPRTTIFHDNT